MSETVRVDLPVIRDAAGDVCCVNERGDECAALYRITFDYEDPKPMCAFGSDLQMEARGGVAWVAPFKGDCPLIWSLRAEGRS